MSVTGTGRHVVQLCRDNDVPFMAASVAYYATASFVPLLLVALAVLSVVGAVDTLLDVLRSALSDAGAQVLDRVLTGAGSHGAAGGVGLLTAVWSGSKVFRGLTTAFDELYSRQPDRSLLEQVERSAVALTTLLVGIACLSALAAAFGSAVDAVSYPAVLGNAVAALVLVLALLPMFYVLTPRSVAVGEVLPGVVVTAVGWLALKVGFAYYAGNAGTYAVYGLLGIVLLFITFLYLGAIVALVGVALNAALDE